jgi:lipoate-protein ligase B
VIETQFFRHSAKTPWLYSDADRLQREIAERARAEQPGALLVFEPAPVITLGRRADTRIELRATEEELAARGIEVHRVDRGGLATYHGPGQWVAFPVDRLERLTGDRRGVRRAVEGLLDALLETARAYEPRAEIRAGCELGVWGPKGKLGAVGIHIERGVLLHGVALNGYRATEASFYGLRPCGLDAPVGYLLENDAEFLKLGELLRQSIQKRFWI